MLMALLFGMALNFLSEEGRCKDGIAFSARTILRLGVALLGVRISFGMAVDLGWTVLGLVIGSVVSTILFGLLIARFFNHGPRFAFLSAGAVAICGASAALAISAILPKDSRSEERLVFTVVGVTVLSTIAMILFPIVAEVLKFEGAVAGIFIGATIHDVAQVVGAGFSVSNEAGEIATVVKLIRVAMLAPVILIASIVIKRYAASFSSTESPPILPGFIVGFMILVAMNSLGFVPTVVATYAAELASWALLTAIAAVGLKTSLREAIEVGGSAIALLFIETAFLTGIVAAGLVWVL